MSIKIYYGYSMPLMTLAKTQKYMDRLRKSINEMLEAMVTEKITQYAVEIIDHGTCRGKKLSPSERKQPLSYARQHVEDRYREIQKTSIRDPEIDFSFSLTLMAGTKKALVICYTEQEKFRQLWASQPGVEEYGYWDNTDQPEGISNKAWKARGKEWQKAMPSYIPAQSGFTIEFIPKYLPQLDAKQHLPFVPSPARRVVEQVESDLFNAYDNSQNHLQVVLDSPILSKYTYFRKWLKTPEGKKKWKLAEKNAISKIKRKLTVVDLLGWDPAKIK